MKFDKLCDLVLKEAYKAGETFIVISEDPLEKFERIPPTSFEKIANNIQVKLPFDKKFVKQIVLDLIEDLPIKDEVSRDDPGTLYSRDDIMEKLARKAAITFNASKSKAFYFAKKLFSLLINNNVILAVKFKDAKKKTPEQEAEEGDKAISGADWLAGNNNEHEDLSQFTGGSFGGKEMSNDWD